MVGIHLRKLEEKDAVPMLEWMHDPYCVKDLENCFADKTAGDCEAFIRDSLSSHSDLHLAVADSEDTYLGTVSLKNINREEKKAEFAIAMRSIAMGTGAAILAMQEIINIGFKKMHLEMIYWYVSPKNRRAIRFYDKNGYLRTQEVPDDHFLENQDKYIWYMVQNRHDK